MDSRVRQLGALRPSPQTEPPGEGALVICKLVMLVSVSVMFYEVEITRVRKTLSA